MCNCILCKLSEKIREVNSEMTPNVKKVIDEVWEYMENKITDLEVEILKLKGEWK